MTDFEKYRLVPIEPDEKMMAAAWADYIAYESIGPQKPAWNARTMWRTMLAAAIPPKSLKDMIQDAFDSGFKAAGGSMIPDGARDMVELSLTREQIEILAAFADNVVEDPADRNYDSAPCLRAFLETVSIYRRRK
jgi:hypothetical protein